MHHARLSSTRTVDKIHRDVLHAMDKALEAANPATIISRHVRLEADNLVVDGHQYDLRRFSRIFVIGAGKAGAGMAEQTERILGNRISGGLVIVPDYLPPIRKSSRIEYLRGSHPIPSEKNVRAVARMLDLVEGLTRRDLVLNLVSGGASSLMEYPAGRVSLHDERILISQLLRSGANIREINTIRKHISRVKGGRLAAILHPATVLTLIISDVIGNEVSAIGSGPTAPDTTTYADAQRVLRDYGLSAKAPARIRQIINAGVNGRIQDTPKPEDPILRNVENLIVGNNHDSCVAASNYMKRAGYSSQVLTTHLIGEAREAGGILGSILLDIRRTGVPLPAPASLTAGGETTVTIQGHGKGGRNQEAVLGSALNIQGSKGLVVASLATDGVDGPTDAAGAIADGSTVTRGRKAGMDAGDYLRRNDSYNYFRKLGDLIRTGPTGTNVNDLMILAAA
jgi:glycerate 2-kinase